MKKNSGKLNYLLIAGVLFLASCKKDSNTQQTEGKSKIDYLTKSDIEMTPERRQIVIDIAAEKDKLLKAGRIPNTTYRNFKIYYGSSVPSDIKKYVQEEIDQVYSCGISSKAISNMQKSIINVYNSSNGYSFYEDKQVYITSLSDYRSVKQTTVGNVILHELTHYYHDVVLPNGFSNSEVLNLYQSAKQRGAYPADAFVLFNEIEYFATSNEGYHTKGMGWRLPFNKSDVLSNDPNAGAFLDKTFDK